MIRLILRITSPTVVVVAAHKSIKLVVYGVWSAKCQIYPHTTISSNSTWYIKNIEIEIHTSYRNTPSNILYQH